MRDRDELDYRDHEEHDDDYYCQPTGWCEACGEECRPVIEDHGIGPYEFWGDRGVDRRLVEVSPCCGASVLKERPDE